ncbi:hypothetical protein FB451DRAFT_1182430 [Mycena latifolia]|nr:hypothetical protein FB451DRAFT_1182430 [Mycena latifolia]
MSQTPAPSAPATETPTSVTGAGVCSSLSPFRLLLSVVSVLGFNSGTPSAPATLATPATSSAMSAPAPPSLTPQSAGPWIAGVIFSVVPPQDLAAIPDGGEELWYGILRSKFVGVIKSHALALDAVVGISNNSMKSYKTQDLALDAFNTAHRGNLVQIRPYCFPLLSPMSTTPKGLSFEELLANLSLDEDRRPVLTPPRTPPPLSTLRTSNKRPTVYYYESPTKSGATAGTATQGVQHAHVHRVQRGSKKRTKKAAYVVFVGRVPGVHHRWSEAETSVKGVSNAIFRGYPTVKEAEEAYVYARAHRWTRRCGFGSAFTFVDPIPSLPTPSKPTDEPNPLHGTESLDNTCLEALLNTVAMSDSLFEGIEGREAAFHASYTAHSVQHGIGVRVDILARTKTFQPKLPKDSPDREPETLTLGFPTPYASPGLTRAPRRFTVSHGPSYGRNASFHICYCALAYLSTLSMPPLAPKIKISQLNEIQLQAFKKGFPIAANAAARDVSSDLELKEHQLNSDMLGTKSARKRGAFALPSRKRAELKTRSPEEQEAYAQRQRAYRTKYHQENRAYLADKAKKHRAKTFIEQFGSKALYQKRATRRTKRKEQEIKQGARDPSPVKGIYWDDSDFEGEPCPF